MTDKTLQYQLEYHLFGVQKSLRDHAMSVNDIGELLPASVMLHELQAGKPVGISYMNDWGCERLGTDVQSINAMGAAYYSTYFVEEETRRNVLAVAKYVAANDAGKQHNFFQRVKLHGQADYKWFYSVCRLLNVATPERASNQLVILSSPVEGLDEMVKRVAKALDEQEYIKKHYRIFAELTRREKEIITLLANGFSSRDIAEQLFVSVHTVQTHRKNIIRKTNCSTFASLIRFALAFDLV